MSEALDGKASSIFVKRVADRIAESENDRESLASVADKVGKMIAMFIDEDLAKKVVWDMMSRIHESRAPRVGLGRSAD